MEVPCKVPYSLHTYIYLKEHLAKILRHRGGRRKLEGDGLVLYAVPKAML